MVKKLPICRGKSRQKMIRKLNIVYLWVAIILTGNQLPFLFSETINIWSSGWNRTLNRLSIYTRSITGTFTQTRRPLPWPFFCLIDDTVFHNPTFEHPHKKPLHIRITNTWTYFTSLFIYGLNGQRNLWYRHPAPSMFSSIQAWHWTDAMRHGSPSQAYTSSWCNIIVQHCWPKTPWCLWHSHLIELPPYCLPPIWKRRNSKPKVVTDSDAPNITQNKMTEMPHLSAFPPH